MEVNFCISALHARKSLASDFKRRCLSSYLEALFAGTANPACMRVDGGTYGLRLLLNWLFFCLSLF
ncbi:hypothetical protein M4R22_17360 [Acidovorax sp. GBBC 3334]|uniref:hypothetical protein n=1 Tax=Acidovorax sp. GBBC 3334 TaxID=2940496 RepID=UPI002304C0CA|nr:hypothetical protein [Acidovorax sp. GBBC 3334]MDA8456532.1 hypothetical protein [Acidovorax sp. GBBC 3334]